MPPFPETGEYPPVSILLAASTRTREELRGVDFESQISRRVFDFFLRFFLPFLTVVVAVQLISVPGRREQ